MKRQISGNAKARKWDWLISDLSKILSHRLFGVTVALIVVVVLLSLLTNRFLSYSNFMNILRYVSVYGIAAIGVTITMLVGGLDISIGSIQGFIGVMCSLVLIKTGSPYLTFLAAIVLGLGVGLINGVIITKGRISDIIVTMSMMFTLRGLTYLSTGAHSVQWEKQTWLDWLGTGAIQGFPAPVLMFLVLVILFHYLLRHTLFGRKVYAVGGNREASRRAGFPTDRVRVIAYMLSAMLAAFAAVILAARLSSGQPNAGQGFEFQVLAGVLLGGISLSGGEGSLVGTFIGVVFFGVLFDGLILLNVSSFWQQFFTGIIVVFAAWLDSRSREKKFLQLRGRA
jgi:ribose transport system permease protein